MTVPAYSIIGGGNRKARREADFYPTPVECTEALLRYEAVHIRKERRVWEPACGDGAVAKVLDGHGFGVSASDLHDRGYGAVQDFLAAETPREQVIVTNPPFDRADEFISHAFFLGVDYMALLLKATFWHARKRQAIFRAWPPSVVYAMQWRPDFDGRASPTMDCIWTVWDVARPGTRYDIMEKP